MEYQINYYENDRTCDTICTFKLVFLRKQLRAIFIWINPCNSGRNDVTALTQIFDIPMTYYVLFSFQLLLLTLFHKPVSVLSSNPSKSRPNVEKTSQWLSMSFLRTLRTLFIFAPWRIMRLKSSLALGKKSLKSIEERPILRNSPTNEAQKIVIGMLLSL